MRSRSIPIVGFLGGCVCASLVVLVAPKTNADAKVLPKKGATLRPITMYSICHERGFGLSQECQRINVAQQHPDSVKSSANLSRHMGAGRVGAQVFNLFNCLQGRKGSKGYPSQVNSPASLPKNTKPDQLTLLQNQPSNVHEEIGPASQQRGHRQGAALAFRGGGPNRRFGRPVRGPVDRSRPI
jgi:hypothetical protein